MTTQQDPAAGGCFRVRLEHLVIRANVPTGMSFYRLGGEALHRARTTLEDDVPTTVRRRPGLPDPYWEILDGRHRFFRAVLAGRVDLLCVHAPRATSSATGSAS